MTKTCGQLCVMVMADTKLGRGFCASSPLYVAPTLQLGPVAAGLRARKLERRSATGSLPPLAHQSWIWRSTSALFFREFSLGDECADGVTFIWENISLTLNCPGLMDALP